MKKIKTREMYKKIEILTKRKTTKLKIIKDANGKTLTEDDNITDRWVEYCKEMYKAEENEGEYQQNNDVYEELPPPLLSEVRKAINTLKKNRSPGMDQINAAMILAGRDVAVSIFHTLITKIWETEQ